MTDREAFESTLAPGERGRNGIGFYLNHDIQSRWQGWQAALEWRAGQDIDALENAHMAGQADAGVDPSYSNAQVYVIELKKPSEEGDKGNHEITE